MVGHRSSLVNALQTACEQSVGVQFHFSHQAEVVSFTPKPTVLITPHHSSDEQPYEVIANIVIAADGVSKCLSRAISSIWQC